MKRTIAFFLMLVSLLVLAACISHFTNPSHCAKINKMPCRGHGNHRPPLRYG